MSRARLTFALIVAAIAFAAAVSLGLWQTRRGDMKLALQAQADSAAHAAAIEIAPSRAALEDVAAALPRKVRISGVFDPAGSVYLDNRSLAGIAGFYVITPLVLGAGLPAALVDRGWKARDMQDPMRTGGVLPPSGPVTIEGIAVARPSTLLELGNSEPRVPGVWQNLDYSAYERATGRAVARFVIREAPPPAGVSADGLRREWPQPATNVERHRGYAFQWYALAALIAVLALYFGFKSRRAR